MNYPITITLSSLRKKRAYFESYNRIVRSLQGRPFTHKDSIRKSYIRYAHKGDILLSSIVHSNCLDHALWALRCIPGIERDARLFAVWCARRVQHLMTSPHSLIALDITTLYANGRATDRDLNDAKCAAYDAAWRAWDTDVSEASRQAGWAALWASDKGTENAVGWAATLAARAASGGPEEDAQKEMFIKMCEGRSPWQETARDMERS
jgi:hypothetical protein